MSSAFSETLQIGRLRCGELCPKPAERARGKVQLPPIPNREVEAALWRR